MEKRKPLFVPLAFVLALNPKIKEITLRKHISRDNRKGRPLVPVKKKGGIIHVNYYNLLHSVQVNLKCELREKFSLPAEVAADRFADWQREQKTSTDTGKADNAVTDFDSQYAQAWEAMKDFPMYRQSIKAQFPELTEKRLTQACKRVAFITWVLENLTGKLTLSVELWNAFFPEDRKEYRSMSNFLNRCKGDGIAATCVDRKWITKKEKRRPVEQVAFLMQLFIQPQKYSPREAFKKLDNYSNELSQKPMSLPTVKLVWREFKSNIELRKQRDGYSAMKKVMPYVDRSEVSDSNTLWHIDGYTVPLRAQHGKRLILVAVMDVFSRKIVGYSVGQSENTVVIMEALNDAVFNTGFLPTELVFDKHSFQQTDIAESFRQGAKAKGVHYTVTTNPQYKAQIERYLQYLNSILKDYPGYLGGGITAKNDSFKISKEQQAELIKPSNWKTNEEVKGIVASAVFSYNNTELDPLNGLSPNQKYCEGKSTRAIAMSEADRVSLFTPVKIYKVTRGEIVVKQGTKKYAYQLPAELFARYNERRVKVICEDPTQGIYVLDLATDEFIASLEPKGKVAAAKADQTADDMRLLGKHKSYLNDIHKHAKRQIDEIKEALNESPEEVELLMYNHILPKDVRKEAEDNYEISKAIRERGINIHNLPHRDEKPVLMPLTTKAENAKPSIYVDPNHKIKEVDKYELLNIQQ